MHESHTLQVVYVRDALPSTGYFFAPPPNPANWTERPKAQNVPLPFSFWAGGICSTTNQPRAGKGWTERRKREEIRFSMKWEWQTANPSSPTSREGGDLLPSESIYSLLPPEEEERAVNQSVSERVQKYLTPPTGYPPRKSLS